MRVLITGAGGFLGRELVAHAVKAGHEVSALVRGGPPDRYAFDPSVNVVCGDLRTLGPWTDVLARIDVVVHAAAAAGGDRSQQLSNTVVATERLLSALTEQRINRFVHVSSLSVYDYRSLPVGGRLDESSSLEPRPRDRDAYTEAKLAQERLIRRWCESRNASCAIVRPGAIVGPGKPWGFGASFSIGRLAFVIAPRAQFRMIALSNCADAIIRAIDMVGDDIDVVNLVDDDLPTNAQFFRMCRHAGAPDRLMVPVPWRAVDAIGRALQMIGTRLLEGRLRTPELLDHRRQEARWKPLTYPNETAHRLLGWRSSRPLTETVVEAVHGASVGGRPTP